MKQSTNYNMNKPDPNDMFSLEHWNQNTDKIDETLAPTFEDYTGETPVPTTDEALKNIKSKTKLSILMQNIKAFCKGCCTLGMLVDNCVTNNNNLPLAASQGKILMDQITSLNSDFSAKNASLEIGQVERGAYIYLRNKVTNNLLMLRLNEDDKKLAFNSEVDGQWGSETQLVTKSDLACGRITVPANTEYLEVSFGKKIDNPSIVVTNIFSYEKNINGSISYVTSDGFRIYPYDTMQNGVPNVQTDFFWIAMSQG